MKSAAATFIFIRAISIKPLNMQILSEFCAILCWSFYDPWNIVNSDVPIAHISSNYHEI